jgi:GNAT superfamily N-acetyltransferase
MSLKWIHENPALWDDDKAAIVGEQPVGIFRPEERAAGDLIGGEWWRVEQDGVVVGYGWMDCTWGDAEMLLAVAPAACKQGVGTFILDRLEREAAERGVNYLHNEVRTTHPDQAGITRWLEQRKFAPASDGRLLRRVVQLKKSE